jgi:hypothetical protein
MTPQNEFSASAAVGEQTAQSCAKAIASVDSAQTSSDVSHYQSLLQQTALVYEESLQKSFLQGRQFDDMLFGLGQWVASFRPIRAELHSL